MLCGELANNFFTDPEKNARFVELVDNIGDQALRAENSPWDSVDFHGRAGIVEGLSKSYKAVRVASDVDTSSLSTVLQSPVQRRTPVQAPKIDLGKTSRAGTASALVGKLRSSKKNVVGTLNNDVRTFWTQYRLCFGLLFDCC